MTDDPEPPESPMRRALRLKQEALAARPKPPGAGKVQRGQAGMAAGKSKPWTTRR
jgi:hypothetical protein